MSLAEPSQTNASDLQRLLNRAVDGDVPVHNSRLPLVKQRVAAKVCNIQKGLGLTPVGLLGSWSATAERRFLEILARPKK